MSIDNPLQVLVGKSAWGARLGFGSFFYLEFGNRGEGEDANHGEYSLWMQHASWRISSVSEWIGSDDDRERIVPWMEQLNGKTVLDASCREFGDLVLTFSEGLELRSFASYRAIDGDPWSLFMPREIVVGVAARDSSWVIEPRAPTTRS